MDARTVAFPESQASSHSSEEESFLPHSSGPESEISRGKVCPACGMVFYKTQRYNLHASLHKLLLDCDTCSYKTKDSKRLRMHNLSNKISKLDNECDINTSLVDNTEKSSGKDTWTVFIYASSVMLSMAQMKSWTTCERAAS